VTHGFLSASAFGPGWWLPADAAAHGPALDRHLLLNLWIALGLLCLLHALLFAGLLLRRRGGSRNRSAALFEYLPVALLTLLFAWLTVRSERLWAATRYAGADPGAMQVEVTGVQFVWYFRYPGKDAAFGRTRPELIAPGEGNPLGIDPQDEKGADDFVSSELVLPVGREVDLRLHAQDVIHGFAVPELRLKQNAVPGQSFHIHFTPTATGSYAIVCTQLCGLGHYRMGAVLRVVDPETFAKWLAEKESPANVSLELPLLGEGTWTR
jgi:cytochrome c oxidase subunit 2